MNTVDLQAHFEDIRRREIKAREHNLDSGLTATLLNLEQFLDEEDVDEAITYLEDMVGIKALIAHKSTFPERLKLKAALLFDAYANLKNNSSDPLDIGAAIHNFLNDDTTNSNAAHTPHNPEH